MIASQLGNTEALALLLARPDVDVNAAETEAGGLTALSLAAEEGHVECVRALLRAPGVDVNVRMADSKATPLHIAAANGHTEVVEVLLAAPGINPTATDDEGRTYEKLL
jgi:ankyrin repeat protein